MAFYCNGKKGMCDNDELCDDCEFWDGTAGKEINTNADKIRAMSDEELYKFCMRITHEGWPFACQHRPECNPTPPMPHWCDECFMLWLKQPAEEEC